MTRNKFAVKRRIINILASPSIIRQERNNFQFNPISGYRESAFAYAISSAGVAYTVARACSQGRVLSCSCDPAYHPKRNLNAEEILKRNTNGGDVQLTKNIGAELRPNRRGPNAWKWGGCSHNLKYGIEFSKMFLDARETGIDIQSQINRHNNQAGRRAVLRNMIFRCKCHGVSGEDTFATRGE